MMQVILGFIFIASQINISAWSQIDPLSVKLQNDLFIQANSCGERQISSHRALSISAKIPKKFIKKNLIIHFEDRLKKFKQTIFYDGKTFFYPGLFQPVGHREFVSIPTENNDDTDILHFFVFLDSNLNSEEHFRYLITIHEANTTFDLVFSKESQSYFPLLNSKNSFLLHNISLNHSKNEISAFIPIEVISKALSDGYRVDFIYSWRTSKSQISYSEKREQISLDHSWIKNKKNEYILDMKLSSLTYLSFLVLIRKNDYSFESKIVVLNVNDKYYSKCVQTTER